jgi:hypothetical protein
VVENVEVIINRKINVDNTSMMKIDVKIEFDINKSIVQKKKLKIVIMKS